MKDGLTWYRIYRRLCTELDIMFPLKQSEISPRVNPIPNNLEFHAKHASKKEVDDNITAISKVYFKLYKNLGEDEFWRLTEEIPTFALRCMEHPDRRVNISTVASILYLSGYKGDTLYEKSLNYLKGERNNA